MNDKEPKKMTIYEYEEKYVKQENGKIASFWLRLLVAVIGIALFSCLFSIAYNVYSINNYVGYAVFFLCLILYVALFLIPIFKIFKADYFKTNVNNKHLAQSKKHNKKVRKSIAEKIVHLNGAVDGAGWYVDKEVEVLETALKKGDDNAIKQQLTLMYGKSIKATAKKIISKNALKSGTYSAVSQNSSIDGTLVAVVNLQMIKDIVFLYGFRPSDAKLIKIFSKVLQNSLIAYGLGGVKVGNGVVKTLESVAKGVPFLGSAIAVLVDSSVQGLTNATLTTVIGFQTIKYLNYEYKLQNILDGVNVEENQQEFIETVKQVEQELKINNKNKSKNTI